MEVKSHNHVTGVVISPDDYEIVRKAPARRCARLLQENAKQAGLTEKEAEELVYSEK